LDILKIAARIVLTQEQVSSNPRTVMQELSIQFILFYL